MIRPTKGSGCADLDSQHSKTGRLTDLVRSLSPSEQVQRSPNLFNCPTIPPDFHLAPSWRTQGASARSIAKRLITGVFFEFDVR